MTLGRSTVAVVMLAAGWSCSERESASQPAVTKGELVAEEVASIGALEGDGPYLFGYAVDAALLPDSGVVVLDILSSELRIFDETGKFLVAAAGPGDGPGELRYPSNVAVSRDGRIRVAESSAISEYERDGRFRDRITVRRDRFEQELPEGMVRSDVAVLPDGHILFAYGPGGSGQTPPELMHRPAGTSGVVRYLSGRLMGSPDGADVVDLGTIPGVEQLAPGHDAPVGLLPLFRQALFLGGGDPTHIYRLDTGEPDIAILNPEGAEVARAQYPHAPEPAQEDDRLAWLESIIDENPPFRDQRTEFLQAWDQATLATHKPLIDQAFVDRAGRLWVKRFQGPGADQTRFDVFGPDGTHDAWATVPGDVTGTDADNGRLLTLLRDHLGVLRVKIFSIRPRR